jgi:hypothetical protein
MVTRPSRLYVESEIISSEAATFLEVPVHDKISNLSANLVHDYFRISEKFRGYVVIHGEGETDGKTRIRFSSHVDSERKTYVQGFSHMISSILESLQNKSRAIIVHPGRYHKNYSRKLQISWLAESLVRLCDLLSPVELCIESRGGDRQGRVLRSVPDDIITLDDILKQSGAKISHCFDLAQAFASFGMEGLTEGMKRLAEHRVPISEIHASDVVQFKTGHRISVEVGKGSIKWRSLTRLFQNFDGRVLLEVIGGVAPFKRSVEFLMKSGLSGDGHAILLPNS